MFKKDDNRREGKFIKKNPLVQFDRSGWRTNNRYDSFPFFISILGGLKFPTDMLNVEYANGISSSTKSGTGRTVAR